MKLYILFLSCLTVVCSSCEVIKLGRSDRSSQQVVTVNFGTGGLYVLRNNRFKLYKGDRERLCKTLHIRGEQPTDNQLLMLPQANNRTNEIEWNILCAQTAAGTWKRVVYLPVSDSLLPFKSAKLIDGNVVRIVTRDGVEHIFELTHRPSGYLWRKTNAQIMGVALFFGEK